jgi:hypothetical protein
VEDSEWGLQSKVWHWQAKWYYEEDIAQVKVHLEELFFSYNSQILEIRVSAGTRFRGLHKLHFTKAGYPTQWISYRTS